MKERKFAQNSFEDLQNKIRSLEEQLADTRAQLRQTEQRFFVAEENARIGVWDFNTVTGRTYLSPGWSLMLGLAPENAPHEWAKWSKLVHPEDLEHVEHAYQRSIRDPNAPYEQEFRMRQASGRYCWVLSRAKALTDGNGKVIRLVGVHFDVTALKEIHEQMRDKERSFEELSVVMPHMFGIADITGRFIFVNPFWTQYSGMSLGETAVGHAWLQVVHPEDRKAVMESWTGAITNKTPYTIEARFQRASDGMYRWHSCHCSPMRRQNGTVERWYVAAVDIHDAKQTSLRLQMASNRYQTLFNSNVVGIVACDRETIREANDAFLNLVGYTREDLTLGRLRYRQMTPPEYAHLDILKNDAYKKHKIVPSFEKEYIRKDGTRIPVLISCVVVDRDPYSACAIVVDLTERKKVENELREIARQLRTTNEVNENFAHLATHDLNEPIKTLSIYLELFLSRHASKVNEEGREILDCAQQACERLSEKISSLTDYTDASKNKITSPAVTE